MVMTKPKPKARGRVYRHILKDNQANIFDTPDRWRQPPQEEKGGILPIYHDKNKQAVIAAPLQAYGGGESVHIADTKVIAPPLYSPRTWQTSVKIEVNNLFETAGIENWDGEGASALTQETIRLAEQIVDALPGDIEKPKRLMLAQTEKWILIGILAKI